MTYDEHEHHLAEKRIRKQLRANNVCAKECGGGGHCLFFSVADQLNKFFPESNGGEEVTFIRLRDNVHSWIKEKFTAEHLVLMLSYGERNKYDRLGTKTDQQIYDLWMHDVKYGDAWGNDLIISVISNLLNIPILVWMGEKKVPGEPDWPCIDYLPDNWDRTRTGKFLAIANVSNRHFYSVYPRYGIPEYRTEYPLNM